MSASTPPQDHSSQYDMTGSTRYLSRRPPAALPGTSSSGKDQCLRIINHEFRALQLDVSLTSMSVFDLIDHCASLFEELTHHLHTEQGFRSYVRSFLIFNYFVNTFIMVHFNGFSQFMESSHQDFIIYLNLYNFFRLDDILGPNAFDVDLADLRQWVIQYLTSKDLLTFDVDLLYGWLNEYIDYLKHKDGDSGVEEGASPSMLRSDTYYKTDGSKLYALSLYLNQDNDNPEDSEDDIFDFNTRFPEVPVDSVTRSPTAGTPYPVDATTKESTVPPYPVADPAQRPPVPAPQSQPIPTISPITASSTSTKISSRPPNFGHYQSAQTSSESHSYPPIPQRIHLQQPLPPTALPNPVSSSLLTHLPLPPTQNHRLQTLPQQPGHTFGYNNSHGNYNSHGSVTGSGNPLAGGYAEGHSNGRQGNGGAFYMKAHLMVPRAPPPQFNSQNGNSNWQMQPNSQNGHGGHVSSQNGHVSSQNGHVSSQNGHKSKLNWMRVHSVCGLKNMGSSCYINLTVQVLFALDKFSQLFLSRSSALGRILKNLRRQPVLVESVANLLATFGSNGGANIAPTKFLRVLSSLKADFNIPFEQQDAQEFLLFLIDRLHEELALAPVSDSVDYLTKWNINVNPKERDEYLKWYRDLVKHEGESPINDMFQGHVQSKLICNTCGHRSVSYSPFSILSLPIPNANASVVDLTDCLRYYTQDEVLSGENAWHCPKCNKSEPKDKENPMDVVFQQKRGMFRFSRRSKSPAKKPLGTTNVPATTALSIKQLSFIKLPPVLFIHLSRFSMFNLTDKLNTDIIYPLRLKFNHSSHDIYYNLTGLINHYGNLKSGHYTSLVNKAVATGRNITDKLQEPAWCYFDDDHIRINVAHGDVNASDANTLRLRDVYVLCYERI